MLRKKAKDSSCLLSSFCFYYPASEIKFSICCVLLFLRSCCFSLPTSPCHSPTLNHSNPPSPALHNRPTKMFPSPFHLFHRTKSTAARASRDLHRRQQVTAHLPTRLHLLSLARDTRNTPAIRTNAQLQLHALPAASRPSSVRKRCVITGRARGVLEEFRVSRIVFREWVNKGGIPGWVKSTW